MVSGAQVSQILARECYTFEREELRSVAHSHPSAGHLQGHTRSVSGQLRHWRVRASQPQRQAVSINFRNPISCNFKSVL